MRSPDDKVCKKICQLIFDNYPRSSEERVAKVLLGIFNILKRPSFDMISAGAAYFNEGVREANPDLSEDGVEAMGVIGASLAWMSMIETMAHEMDPEGAAFDVSPATMSARLNQIQPPA